MSYVLCLCGERCYGEDNLAAHDSLAAHIERAHGRHLGHRVITDPVVETVQARYRRRLRGRGHPTTDSR